MSDPNIRKVIREYTKPTYNGEVKALWGVPQVTARSQPHDYLGSKGAAPGERIIKRKKKT